MNRRPFIKNGFVAWAGRFDLRVLHVCAIDLEALAVFVNQQLTEVFDGDEVPPRMAYVHDALYRLTSATDGEPA